MDYTLQFTINEELLKEIRTAIKEAVKEELPKLQNYFRKGWLSTKEVMELLHVSRRTLQNYRNEGKLSYTQFADTGKILYPREEIEAFLQEHMVKRTSPNSSFSAIKPQITHE